MKISSTEPVYLVLPSQTIPAEETAAKELSYYLGQITGATCETVREDATGSLKGTLIYVGPTQFAKKYISGKSTFSDEEWLMQTQDNALILTGGRPRGTLYAAYHFLEDVCGVRWWNSWEETVPHTKVLSVPLLKKRSQPAFAYRNIFDSPDPDGGRFAARSRINARGDRPIDVEYGRGRVFGPPYQVHTFYRYLPPAKYYKDHPDWYTALNNGKITSSSQLALDNQEMRQEFLKVLRETIRTSRQAAIADHLPPPNVFDVSSNDGGFQYGAFTTDKNSELYALVQKEHSDSAAILDFVNYLADGVRDEFPDVFIETLAYHGTEKPPATMRARDNVIIRLCNTQSNMLEPITAEQNSIMRENTEKWEKQTKHLWIWDYYRTYDFTNLPLPTVQTYATNLQFFKEHHVEGLFIEFEEAIPTDMRDMKFWVLCKLMEDPYQDSNALVREFTDGFYGAAGPDVRRYLETLQKAAAQSKTIIGLSLPTEISGRGLLRYSYLTMDFLQQAEQIYDQAAVADDPVLSRRVRHARFPVDHAILLRYNHLWYEWQKAGHTPETFPFDRVAVAERFRRTWYEQIELRANPEYWNQNKEKANAAVDLLVAGRGYVQLPDSLKNVPLRNLFIYGALDVRNPNSGNPGPVTDEEASSGITDQLKISDVELAGYKLPIPWVLFEPGTKKRPASGVIKETDIPNGGYNWYKLGVITLPERSFVYLFSSSVIQLDLNNAYDPQKPDQQFDIWANIKFSGTAYPHGKAGDKNAISVESLVLVRH